MTARDVLINTGILIGRPDIVSYFGEQINVGEETYEDIQFLLKIIGLVISELSTTYFPLISKQFVTFNGGILSYDELYKKVVKIIKVYDQEGKNFDFIDETEEILLKDNNSDVELFVEYQYLPEEYTDESEIDYQERDIPTRVIAYGVAAEYCISQGKFDEAVMHHKRYMSALQEIKGIKNVKIKGRSFK
ncbi:MAG: hypothetical protein E7372_04630 [Clostridiales bacterium]|nr:hypothetical protein [Clostridiales bacterium]